MLRLSLCDYSDSYILFKGTITVSRETNAAPNNANKKVIFKNRVPFTNCISRINNAQIDDPHDIDLVMSMYNFIEYSDNYSKTSAMLQQYCQHKPNLANNVGINDFNEGNATSLFDRKEKTTAQTDNNGTKNVEVMLLLKYLISGELLKCL